MKDAMNEALKPAPAVSVSVGNVVFGNALPLAVMAGPCALESRAHALETAAALKEIAGRLGIGLVYKSSFDKANRTSLGSARGLGLKEALPIFAEIRESTGLPVVTDVHEPDQCAAAAEAVDVLQIPAFLCRQTDLLVAAARTGKAVNVKKGQFLAPWDMRHVVAKVAAAGNPNVLVTERGVSFGYNTLVSDMRALPILAETGAPVIFDATHSVQQPGGQGGTSGGERRFVPVLARAAAAVGIAGVFIETHQDPDTAPSDGPNMVPLREFEGLLKEIMSFDALAKNRASLSIGLFDLLRGRNQMLRLGIPAPEPCIGEMRSPNPTINGVMLGLVGASRNHVLAEHGQRRLAFHIGLHAGLVFELERRTLQTGDERLGRQGQAVEEPPEAPIAHELGLFHLLRRTEQGDRRQSGLGLETGK